MGRGEGTLKKIMKSSFPKTPEHEADTYLNNTHTILKEKDRWGNALKVTAKGRMYSTSYKRKAWQGIALTTGSRAGTSALAVLPRSFRGNIKRGGYQTELGHLDGSIKKVLFTSTGNKVSSPQS